MADGKIIPQSGTVFACATMRQESWSGIQQEISARVEAKVVYNVQGLVRIYGNHVKSATVQATLWFQTPDGQDHYIVIALIKCDRINCFDFSEWRSVIVYVEGPPPGTDILLNGLLIVKEAEKLNSPSTRVVPVIEECEGGNLGERENWEKPSEQENVINDVEGEGEMKGAAAIPFPGTKKPGSMSYSAPPSSATSITLLFQALLPI
ncbi:hypothetical protein COLO4_25076 [Corchorus olitorius]|uniref:Uncharacterized protein n=1 Tax=Corchorus olitorius TaxID=93759 RepID=A0A1R3I4T7_9ROSI|nr:hypothetical protein COLO4_25076 [Corchorus olitorius]